MSVKRDETIISIDFQGWPVRKMCVRNILMALGAKFNNQTNKFEIDNDGKLLNAYPLVLEDDGMGYGVNERYITEVDSAKASNGEHFVHIFTEKELPAEELEKLFENGDYPDEPNRIEVTLS